MAGRSVCMTGEGIHLLPRLPELAAPHLHFELAGELNQLRQKDSWKLQTGRSSKTLAKYPNLRIVLVLMKVGTEMRQRRAIARISIQALKGMVRIDMAEGSTTLQAGELLVLDCGVLHDIQALQESALLLSLSWPTQQLKGHGRERRVNRQRQFDNEALERMDNEGGMSS
ncbi:MAG TPA: hypothetical protein VE998_07765 [Terriglobales bacterium]|nr:hypothetical protein [Terriglobales bacterium]